MKKVTAELVREVFTAWAKTEGKTVEIQEVGSNDLVPDYQMVTYLDDEKTYLAMFGTGGLVSMHRRAYNVHPETIARLEKEAERLAEALRQARQIPVTEPEGGAS